MPKTASPTAKAPRAIPQRTKREEFRRRYYSLSTHLSTFLIAISTVCFFVVPIRDREHCASSELLAGVTGDAATYVRVACGIMDLSVWGFVCPMALCVALKWWHYKRHGWHYFMLDYCYMHNACLIAYFVRHLVLFDGPALAPYIRLPRIASMEEHALWLSANPAAGWYEVLAFHVLFSGSVGVLLGGGVLLWRNSLVLHDLDRMSSTYLHFGPPLVQALYFHFLAHSPARALVFGPDAVDVGPVLAGHFAMFMLWVVFHYGFIEVRLLHRSWRLKRKGKTAEEIDAEMRQVQVTAYSYMMNKPLGGRRGLPYRFVTMFGEGPRPTKALFGFLQWCLHAITFFVGYVGIVHFGCARWQSSWPVFVWVLFFYCVAVFNAANFNRRWVRKLQDAADASGGDSS